MAVTRGATVTQAKDTATPIITSFSHTVNSNTTLLIVSFHCEGDLGIASPAWNTTETMTLISSVTSSSSGGDCRVYVYGRESPTATTANVTFTVSGAGDNLACVAVNYLGTVASSVADATNAIDSEDNANAAAQTIALSGATVSGSTLVCAATFYGDDGDPAAVTGVTGFSDVATSDTGGGSATTDTSYYYGDKIGGGTGGTLSPTVDWTGTISDECVGVFFEIIDATQTLTQSSRFDNSNTLNYAHTVTPGTVTLTASLFTNSNSLAYQHAVSQSQALQQSARFDNSNGLAYTHALSLILTPSLFTNTNGLAYQHQVDLTLLQSALFENANGLAYQHTLSQGQGLAQDARFDNEPTFYAHTLTPGAVTLTADLFSNSNALAYQHALTLNLTPDLFSNANSLAYQHTLTPGAVTLTQSARYDDADGLAYAHVLTPGTVTLTQASRYDDADSLAYQHDVSQGTVLTASLYTNANTFYAAVLRNQYPDPAQVRIGIVYGVPGLELTGTYEGGGYDGTLKVDVVSGRMVKLVSNKVAISL